MTSAQNIRKIIAHSYAKKIKNPTGLIMNLLTEMTELTLKTRQNLPRTRKFLSAKPTSRLLLMLHLSSPSACWLSPCQSNTPGHVVPAPEYVAAQEHHKSLCYQLS